MEARASGLPAVAESPRSQGQIEAQANKIEPSAIERAQAQSCTFARALLRWLGTDDISMNSGGRGLGRRQREHSSSGLVAHDRIAIKVDGVDSPGAGIWRGPDDNSIGQDGHA